MNIKSTKNPLIIVPIVFLLIAGYFVFTDNNAKNQAGESKSAEQSANKPVANNEIETGETVFFWGEGCSHCENVKKFFQDNNNLDQKLSIKQIEVFGDKAGQKLFMEKVQECKLNSPGVPVLYKDGKCIQGDAPIIEELKKNL